MPQELKKNIVGHETDENLGRSRGGITSKIHCIVDSLGNPVDFVLTGGQVHDSVCAERLLEGKSGRFVIADRAYDSDKILEFVEKIRMLATSTTNRVKYFTVLYFSL